MSTTRRSPGLETDYFVAMGRYDLGEIPRRQFQAIPIRLPEAPLLALRHLEKPSASSRAHRGFR